MDCTSKLIKMLFEKTFSCARTKTEAVIKNVIKPYELSILKIKLENTRFITIYSDAYNHKDLKLFPSLVRYFDCTTGIQVKVLDLVSLPGETSETIVNSIIKILRKNNLTNKLIAYCADNTNSNFGGVHRKGNNNVFFSFTYRIKSTNCWSRMCCSYNSLCSSNGCRFTSYRY